MRGRKGSEQSDLISFISSCLRSIFSCFPFSFSYSSSLSSCSRSVTTEPGVVNFLIESMPTNLDPRIGTDGQSERIDSLIFNSLVELDAQRIPHGDLAEHGKRLTRSLTCFTCGAA